MRSKSHASSSLLFSTWIVIILLPLAVAAEVPNETCAACHDQAQTWGATPHGVYFSDHAQLASASCEACHGSALGHIEGGDPSQIINPADNDWFSGKSLCLDCHKGQHFDDWYFSAHENAGVGCSECHTIHGTKEQSVKKAGPELCYDCHSSVRAATFLPSHHPIREGKMGCIDCHNPHGGAAARTLENTSRELCFSCHPEIEGPYVYEHAPVNEDCGYCHNPHGSVADNLLKQNEPALCLSCHPMHFHSISQSVDGAFTTPQAPERAGVSTLDGFKAGMLTKCTQCHSMIHGSDAPSQAGSNGGTALTR